MVGDTYNPPDHSVTVTLTNLTLISEKTVRELFHVRDKKISPERYMTSPTIHDQKIKD